MPLRDLLPQLSRYLKAAFPAAVLTLRNGAIPATGSAYAYRCFEKVVDDDVSALQLHTCTQQLLPHAHASCKCIVLVTPVL
jgi:hypothetical protein